MMGGESLFAPEVVGAGGPIRFPKIENGAAISAPS
jgi:hypothetical protein